MTGSTRRPPPPAPEDWPESVLPGQRSGEGSADLWKHVERDERRKAGQGPMRTRKPAPEAPPPPPVDPKDPAEPGTA